MNLLVSQVFMGVYLVCPGCSPFLVRLTSDRREFLDVHGDRMAREGPVITSHHKRGILSMAPLSESTIVSIICV